MAPLHTYVFGPPDGQAVVALHGLTGHGRRWEHFASSSIPEFRVIAPDLLGHGRSPWRPPWGLDDHVDAVATAVETQLGADEPFVLVGHSFGGAIAVRLAARMPDQVRRLILLDPAQGLDPVFALEVSTDSLDNWDYANADAARAAKLSEGWADVPTDDRSYPDAVMSVIGSLAAFDHWRQRVAMIESVPVDQSPLPEEDVSMSPSIGITTDDGLSY